MMVMRLINQMKQVTTIRSPQEQESPPRVQKTEFLSPIQYIIFFLSLSFPPPIQSFSFSFSSSQMAATSSSSSSSSLSNETETDKSKCIITNFGSNCALLSSAFTQTPLLSPFFRPCNKPNLSPMAVPNAVRDLHNSIISTADKCCRLIENFASENPFLNKIFSLSSDFHNFSQIRCRNARNLNALSNLNFAAIIPGDSVAGVVVATGFLNFLNLYNTLLVARLVLTWFPNSPPAIVGPLSTICDPYLNIFRGLIPPLGGTLDLSPILAFLVLNAFTSTASALPAELPSTGASQERTSSHTSYSSLTTPQEKWIRRLGGNKPKSSTGVN